MLLPWRRLRTELGCDKRGNVVFSEVDAHAHLLRTQYRLLHSESESRTQIRKEPSPIEWLLRFMGCGGREVGVCRGGH